MVRKLASFWGFLLALTGLARSQRLMNMIARTPAKCCGWWLKTFARTTYDPQLLAEQKPQSCSPMNGRIERVQRTHSKGFHHTCR